ncbi:MAG: HAMP domain-containing histidine kinase [Flavobacteriales bacterium]|nr:HAMP domain-containing histidine kinase [Flavobacteriales bacterium]
MKLIRQTNRNFAIIILIVLPQASLLLFVSLDHFLSDEVDEKLKVDELRITEQLRSNPNFISMAPIIEVKQLSKKSAGKSEIKNVFVYDPIEKEKELFRQLSSIKRINGNWYSIKVRHSIIENKDFALAIGLTMIAILLLTFAFLLLLNYRFSKKLWRPFYHNLDVLKHFSFSGKHEIQLKDSKITEFQDLKYSLEKLTNKLQSDFRSLKEFTENASHEIQTPLSIISLNLEEVLQDEHTEENYKKLYHCYQSIQRLSKLNDRLLLLAKLDNDQFNGLSEVNFNRLFEAKLEEFIPLLNEREISMNIHDTGTFIHECDPILANMLVVNLLSNVVKHASTNSVCTLDIGSGAFSLINETSSHIKQEALFERFKKGNAAQSSTGLGLSIVKRIVEVSSLTIQVELAENEFKLTINKA